MELVVLVIAWMVGGGSPGPATMAIAGTAMQRGRAAGLAVASGIVTGSAFWGVAAALGMSVLMLTHVWLFETLRYVGALFLIYLGYKALRSAMRADNAAQIWQTYGVLITASSIVFFGYGFLFSSGRMIRAYARARRWFEVTFGLLFGAAGLTLLFARGQTT